MILSAKARKLSRGLTIATLGMNLPNGIVFEIRMRWKVMRLSLTMLVLCAGAFTSGCAQKDQRSDNIAERESPDLEDGPKIDEQSGPWTYKSQQYDFALTLPSSRWKQSTKQRFIADFWCPTRIGSPMLVGVMSVKKQSQEQFRASIPTFKKEADKGEDYYLRPTIREGVTDAGNAYVYAEFCEKGNSEDQFIFVATAAVWVANKELTVSIIFEGQGKMRSKIFQSIEYSQFEAEAKAICLSPK